jgi:hypothetical protein
MPPAKNQHVHSHWHVVKDNSDPKKVSGIRFMLIKLQVEWGCNYCQQTYKAHPTRQKEHLKVCRKYLKSTVKDSNEINTTFDDQSVVESAQAEINFPRLTSRQKHGLDLQAAM